MARSLIPFAFEASFPMRSGGDPFLQLHREMNRLFDDAWRGYGAPAEGGRGAAAPRVNVSETDSDLRVEVELPGVPERDVQVELTGDVLSIRGERRASRQDGNYHVLEHSYGSFQRAIRLPFTARPEQIHAAFEHGVLTITVPKSAAEVRSQRIQIRSGAGTAAGGDVDAGHAGRTMAEGFQESKLQDLAQGGDGAGGSADPERETMAHGMAEAGASRVQPGGRAGGPGTGAAAGARTEGEIGRGMDQAGPR